MKVTVYNKKGGAGKTPIAMNIARTLDWAIGANERNKLTRFFPEERILEITKKEEFPGFPDHIDIVFDLGGGLDEGDSSILSAVKQSDLIFIPVFNDLTSMEKAEETYHEIVEYNSNIVFIATRLEHKSGDLKISDPAFSWSISKDFIDIQEGLKVLMGTAPEMIPLQKSPFYNDIKMGKHLEELRDSWPLQRANIQKIIDQFSLIFNRIDNYDKA